MTQVVSIAAIRNSVWRRLRDSARIDLGGCTPQERGFLMEAVERRLAYLHEETVWASSSLDAYLGVARKRKPRGRRRRS